MVDGDEIAATALPARSGAPGTQRIGSAEALFTSQPGISQQIRLLEEELGVDVFVRNGKRVVAVTESGRGHRAGVSPK